MKEITKHDLDELKEIERVVARLERCAAKIELACLKRAEMRGELDHYDEGGDPIFKDDFCARAARMVWSVRASLTAARISMGDFLDDGDDNEK